MKDPLRPITLGIAPSPGAPPPSLQSLDPFVIDPHGVVINVETGKKIKKRRLKTALFSWNSKGPWGSTYELDVTHPEMRGPRIPSLKTTDVAGESWADWLVFDITPAPVYDGVGELPKPKIIVDPSRRLQAIGDTSHGWMFLWSKQRFMSLFHAPSLAAHIFYDKSST